MTMTMRNMTPSSSPAPTRCAPSRPNSPASRLLKLPLLAVGGHTAAAARHAGFSQVIAAKGDAAALSDLVLRAVKTKQLKKAATMLYLAGADLAHDLAGELGEHGSYGRDPHDVSHGSGVQPAA